VYGRIRHVTDVTNRNPSDRLQLPPPDRIVPLIHLGLAGDSELGSLHDIANRVHSGVARRYPAVRVPGGVTRRLRICVHSGRSGPRRVRRWPSSRKPHRVDGVAIADGRPPVPANGEQPVTRGAQRGRELLLHRHRRAGRCIAGHRLDHRGRRPGPVGETLISGGPAALRYQVLETPRSKWRDGGDAVATRTDALAAGFSSSWRDWGNRLARDALRAGR